MSTPNRDDLGLARRDGARWLLWIPPILYAALIFFLSSESRPLPELTSLMSDKILHGAEYAGLGLLLCRALRGERITWRLSIVCAIGLASVYAGSDEWHQSFVPGRNSDVLDWIADTMGGALGSVMYRWIATLIQRP
jgi:VanZ family protein